MAITGATDLGNGKLAVTIDHNPATTATNAPIGSLIITTGGIIYRKTDNGSSTNVTNIGGGTVTVRFVSGADSVLSTDYMLLCDSQMGPFTINLPDTSSNEGRVLVFSKQNGSMNAITLDPYLSQLINSVYTYDLVNQNSSVMLICATGAWRVVSEKTS
jgi:hypothetical protein